MKSVLVILAPGFEEVEGLAPVDILRRAGADVITAGTVDGIILGRNEIKVLADESLDQVETASFDMVVLPGGLDGTRNLMKDDRVASILRRHAEDGKCIAAICAAPTVLLELGISQGKKVTSHPSVSKDFPGKLYSEARVVVDGNIITSRGPGTALEFSFKLVEVLFGQEKVDEVNGGVLARI